MGESVLNRFSLLFKVGGWNALLRTMLMLAGAAGIAIAEFVYFRSFYCGILIVVCIVLG